MTELKQEDVMRALECCDGTFGGCERCPNYKNRFRCTIKENALALLREKEKEIERLQAQYSKVLENTLKSRAEAVDEFAERLTSHEFYEVADQYDGMLYVDFCCWVDKIAEEMKGAKE